MKLLVTELSLQPLPSLEGVGLKVSNDTPASLGAYQKSPHVVERSLL